MLDTATPLLTAPAILRDSALALAAVRAVRSADPAIRSGIDGSTRREAARALVEAARLALARPQSDEDSLLSAFAAVLQGDDATSSCDAIQDAALCIKAEAERGAAYIAGGCV